MFHASYVLQVISRQIDQTLVPVRDFVICGGLKTQRLPLHNLSEPSRDGLAPLAKAADIPVPLDPQKLSVQASPRPPTRNSRIEKSLNTHESATNNALPSIGLAQQSTLVDSLAPHNTYEQLKQERTSVPPSQTSLVPAAASVVSLSQDCPLIDLLALVREQKKFKKVQKKKPLVLLRQEKPLRRVEPRGPSSESFR